MILKSLIVDDEYPARQEIRYLLDEFDDVEVIGEATSADEAMKLIDAMDYDILFLDINLPGASGIKLSESIKRKGKKPQIIFVTAYENHALEAFNVNAIDYILKPIGAKRLREAIDKVVTIMAFSDEHSDSENFSKENKNEVLERILVEKNGKLILLDVQEICFAHSEENSVYIKTYDERFLTRMTLKELEERLDNRNFLRTHRSFIVNLSKIRELEPFFNGTYNLIIEDSSKSEVPVSRSSTKMFRKFFGKKNSDN